MKHVTLFSTKLLGVNLNRTLMSSSNDMKIEYLKQSLAEFNKPNYYEYLGSKNQNIKCLRKSAVLVPISVKLVKNTKGHFVQKSFYTLTKRTTKMNSFKGQTCFVGGMCDSNDKNEIETAVREANEEIGFQPSELAILAQIYPVLTSNKLLITPVVAFFDHTEFNPVLNKDEVDTVFEIPTDRFILSHDHEIKSVKLKNNDEYFIHSFKDLVNGELIKTWGVTALICIAVSTMLHSRAPDFKVDPKFEFKNDNVNEYLEFNALKSIERIMNVTRKK